jgi:hypothetical protein
MNILDKLLNNQGEVILTILFVVFLFMGYEIPQPLSLFIDSVIGKMAIIILAFILFFNSSPILGILGFFVAYELIKRSMISTGSMGKYLYNPSEYNKESTLTALNQFPYTLEEEVVQKMARPKNSYFISSQSYQPVMDKIYDSQELNNIN